MLTSAALNRHTNRPKDANRRPLACKECSKLRMRCDGTIYAPPDLVEGHFGVLRARREKLILDWRKQQQSRTAVRLTIEKMLDPGGHNCHARTGHKEAA